MEVIFFWNYRLQKARLLKCRKSPLSEHLWTVNMLKGPKDCFNLHGSIFAIFFDNYERKSAPKVFFWNYLRSWDCFLRYWQPMTTILSHQKRMFNATNSNAIISKSKIICWIFFCISGIYIKSVTLWKKRWASEPICFWNYRLQKAGLLKYWKAPY